MWSRHRSYVFRFARASCSRERAALAFAPFGRRSKSKEGLIVAFIVDAFLSQFEDNRALCEDENIASLDQSRAGEGFRIIASKRSSKDDIYRAMFLEDDD